MSADNGKQSDAGTEFRDWWQTGIIDMEPGKINLRGYPVQSLIGELSFVQMIWLMVRGEVPDEKQAALLEAALVAAVDHGPLAPSIATARMAMTCGIGINSAMASAINVLGDVHGGAGQGALEIYLEILGHMDAGESLDAAVDRALAPRLAEKQIIPGFGHRFHPIDPRTPRLFELCDKAVADGVIGGRFVAIGKAVEAWLEKTKGRHLPMNIDGVTAVIYGELGFEPDMARGLFILSRSVGILAHAYEQKQQGGRIKGPVNPKQSYKYTGPGEREL